MLREYHTVEAVINLEDMPVIRRYRNSFILWHNFREEIELLHSKFLVQTLDMKKLRGGDPLLTINSRTCGQHCSIILS